MPIRHSDVPDGKSIHLRLASPRATPGEAQLPGVAPTLEVATKTKVARLLPTEPNRQMMPFAALGVGLVSEKAA